MIEFENYLFLLVLFLYVSTATFPRQIESLAKKILTQPIEIVIGLKGQSSKNVEQHVEVIPKHHSFIRLMELLKKTSAELEAYIINA